MCLALGADLVGLASPLLKAAARGADDAVEALDILGAQLRIAMFGIGVRDIAALRGTTRLRRIMPQHL